MNSRSQTAIFSKLVRQFMRPVVLSVPAGIRCGDVVSRMAAEKASSVVIVDRVGCPIGIFTEQDITRRVAFRVPPETPIDRVMTGPVLAIGENEYLYHAIANMRRRGLRHMPVVDTAGVLVGMLDLHDALAIAADKLMGQIDRLTREGTLEGLREVKGAQVELAEELFADSVPAPEVQALLTHMNNDIYRRIVDITLGAMANEGWGPPPVPFTTIVMGSGGRGENYLYPDQDNGLILADYPDEEHDRIDRFFREFAERINRDLNEVGFPYCTACCMANNPLWRKTLGQWTDQLAIWVRRPETTVVRLADLFFDFQPVSGAIELAAGLRGHVTEVLRGNRPLVQRLFFEEADHQVALGFFGHFITEKEKADYRGQINLKHTGTLPLVEAVRLLSLREGVRETSTLRRIEALTARGVLDSTEREYLMSAFAHITRLLLRQQIADYRAGNTVSNYVAPENLSKREKSLLIDSFKAIDALRRRVKAEFTAPAG